MRMRVVLNSSFVIALVLLVAWAATAQEPSLPPFQDELLNHLAGKWNAHGTVHGKASKQALEAEWVLHHQFLRIYEKSAENVAGTDFPYEGVLFIGYDNSTKRYVAHLMNVFGGEDSTTLGYGEHTGNEMKLVFGSVVQRFVWEPASKRWHIVSSVDRGSGRTEQFIELTATAVK